MTQRRSINQIALIAAAALLNACIAQEVQLSPPEVVGTWYGDNAQGPAQYCSIMIWDATGYQVVMTKLGTCDELIQVPVGEFFANFTTANLHVYTLQGTQCTGTKQGTSVFFLQNLNEDLLAQSQETPLSTLGTTNNVDTDAEAATEIDIVTTNAQNNMFCVNWQVVDDRLEMQYSPAQQIVPSVNPVEDCPPASAKGAIVFERLLGGGLITLQPLCN